MSTNFLETISGFTISDNGGRIIFFRATDPAVMLHITQVDNHGRHLYDLLFALIPSLMNITACSALYQRYQLFLRVNNLCGHVVHLLGNVILLPGGLTEAMDPDYLPDLCDSD